jgi:RNA 3'-terminal phosphate cyclase
LDVPEEERREAEKTGELVCAKLLEIMDLQADIDALLRDKHPTPFGSARFKNSRPETLQRIVTMTAIQFILFEPENLVKGNQEVHAVGKKLIDLILGQLKLLRKTEPKG